MGGNVWGFEEGHAIFRSISEHLTVDPLMLKAEPAWGFKPGVIPMEPQQQTKWQNGLRTHVCMRTHTFEHTHTHTHALAPARAHALTCAHACTITHIPTYMRTHTPLHSLKGAQARPVVFRHQINIGLFERHMVTDPTGLVAHIGLVEVSDALHKNVQDEVEGWPRCEAGEGEAQRPTHKWKHSYAVIFRQALPGRQLCNTVILQFDARFG